jgi:CysZ protein
MPQVLDALARALRDLFRLDVLWVVIWPMLAASLFWLVVGIGFWSTFASWIAQALVAVGVEPGLSGFEPHWIAAAIQLLIHFFLFVPLVLTTALMITALFAMPALIRSVAGRHYPTLDRKHGGSFIGSLGNALIALLVFIAIWIVTLPTWLIGIGFLVPFAATAYFNQRLFRYDALAEHASATEMRALFRQHRAALWSLGLVTGLVQFIPLVNLFAPVLSALAFIHFGLDRLDKARLVNSTFESSTSIIH